MEEWRDVPGYEGLYQISINTKEGKCRSLNYHREGSVKALSNKLGKSGRLFWVLSKNGVQTTQQAGVWIALTYPELIENEWFEGAEIDHIDTDPLNNQPTNLRWVTHMRNQNNPLTKKHISQGCKGIHINRKELSKCVIQLSRDNEIIKTYPSAQQAARETGIDNSNICACCRGKHRTAGGFVWKYAE